MSTSIENRFRKITEDELWTYIGIIFIMMANDDCKLPTKRNFKGTFYRGMYENVMSKSRFKEIRNFMMFII